MYFKVVTASGGWRAQLYGGNGELVWWTEVYTSQASAYNAIRIAKETNANTPVR